MMSPAAPLYRIFRRADPGEAPSVRALAVAMIALAVAIVVASLIRVSRQHEVLELGYQLSREAEHVRELHEAQRRLELERATLAAPDRIRKLATELGMTPVAPDKIRIVAPRALAARP
jgi:cell division protein FtsL